MDAPGWLTERPIAHRGLHDAPAGIIENTQSAVIAAIDAGYGVEVDLQASRDDEAMVFHDASLDRLTHETGRVAARPAEALADVTMRETTDGVMTLKDLLALVAGRAPLFLEIKGDGGSEGLARRIGALLTRYRGDVAVMSFEPEIVAAMARAAPERPRGLISARHDGADERALFGGFERFKRRHLLTAFTLRPHFIAYDIRALPTAATMTARAFGLPLLTWTVRTEADRKRAARFADQIIFEGFRP